MSFEFELLLRGGVVVGRESEGACDLAINGSVIEVIEVAGSIEVARAREVIDVTARLIAPAFVDLSCGVARSDAECLRGGVATEVAAYPSPAPSAVRRLRTIALPRADRIDAAALAASSTGFRAYGHTGSSGEGLAWLELEAAVMRLAGANRRVFIAADEFGDGARGREIAVTERCIALARRSGIAMHLLAVSQWGALDAIAEAKAEGLEITASVTVDVFSAAAEEPLGRQRFGEALRDGTVDSITAAAVTLPTVDDLLRAVTASGCELSTAFERAATRPALLLGLPCGAVRPGLLAELLVLDVAGTRTGYVLRHVVLGSLMIAP